MATAEIDGAQLYYEEHGTGSPVLLIHGNGAIIELWGQVIDGLAGAHRVIAYERRGFGHSSHPPVRDFRRHDHDAAALLERLGAGPATVVGWSAGGVVALELAAARPELVDSLVLLEPALIFPRGSAAMYRASVAWELRRHRDEERAAWTFFRWASRYTTGGNAFDAYPEAWQARMLSNAPAVWRENFALMRSQPGRWRRVASIRCPVTTIAGGASDPAFGRAVAQLRRRLSQATVRGAPEASHMLGTDASAEVVAAIRDASARRSEG